MGIGKPRVRGEWPQQLFVKEMVCKRRAAAIRLV